DSHAILTAPEIIGQTISNKALMCPTTNLMCSHTRSKYSFTYDRICSPLSAQNCLNWSSIGFANATMSSITVITKFLTASNATMDASLIHAHASFTMLRNHSTFL